MGYLNTYLARLDPWLKGWRARIRAANEDRGVMCKRSLCAGKKRPRRACQCNGAWV